MGLIPKDRQELRVYCDGALALTVPHDPRYDFKWVGRHGLKLDGVTMIELRTTEPMPDDRPELDRHADTQADAEREARLDALSAPERPDDGRD